MVDTPQHGTAANTPHNRDSSAPPARNTIAANSHHGTDAHNDELQAEAQDEGAGRRLVGLVANGGRGVGFHFASLAGGGIPGQRSTVFPAIPA